VEGSKASHESRGPEKVGGINVLYGGLGAAPVLIDRMERAYNIYNSIRRKIIIINNKIIELYK
jgi:hypothetical protein